QVDVQGAAVVERNEDGSVDIKDEVGDTGYEGMATGGIIGLVVGIIGGPLGVLVGGATGLLVGSLFDMDDVDDDDSVVTDMSRSVTVGHASVLAEVTEENPEVIDSAAERLGGTVVRRSLDDVEAEIAAAEDAQAAAKKAARKRLREKRHEERKEKVEAKVAELKSKLHIGHPAKASQG
ncbi:MAG TPA: DUF1269 domain-containing protein, partial [Solirubrobacterales bacterium]|nr:DUF1269 domain-containing protein [Solirubrobacterales bacterium]